MTTYWEALLTILCKIQYTVFQNIQNSSNSCSTIHDIRISQRSSLFIVILLLLLLLVHIHAFLY